MNVSGVSSQVIDSVANTASSTTPAAVNVLKKAQDIQLQTATQLLQSIPDPTSNLGQNVDVKV